MDGARFEPDFILLLKDSNGCNYQIFCEPKGTHLIEFDKWKDEFLEDITRCTENGRLILENMNENALPFYENGCYKILGLSLYNYKLESEFKTEFKNLLEV